MGTKLMQCMFIPQSKCQCRRTCRVCTWVSVTQPGGASGSTARTCTSLAAPTENFQNTKINMWFRSEFREEKITKWINLRLSESASSER